MSNSSVNSTGREEAIELVENCRKMRIELEEIEVAQENGIDTLVSNATLLLDRKNLDSLEEDDIALSSLVG